MPSNVDAVIGSVRDLKSDIRDNIIKQMLKALQEIKKRITMYINRDANYRGALKKSIRQEYDTTTDSSMEFTVYSDSRVAPYNGLVEFGSGAKTNDAYIGTPTPTPDEYPPEYPYSAPDIETGTGKYYWFRGIIMNWMEEKPIIPASGDMVASAGAIASEIIEKGTYAHPYMRPAAVDKEDEVYERAVRAINKATQ
jgi:hypothetical protein